MAYSSNSLILFLSSCSLFFVLVVARKEFALEASEEKAHHFHTLQLSSILPSSICNPSAGSKKKGSLEVVHKYGPCSKFNEEPLTAEEVFTHDQSRVDSIRARLATNTWNKDTLDSKTTLPAKSGNTIGSGNYIVTVGLGTPKKDLSLIFDTGSDFTWTQCQPCAGSCYSQKEPIFAPSMSTTYTNISCTSTYCSDVTSATGGFPPRCFSSTCVYTLQYVDKSFSSGFLAKEKLTLTPNDEVDGFFFGCGEDNQGLFRGAAGLIGLGRDKLSLVSQTANKYGEVFSYCLPSSSSSTGYLTFGKGGVASNVKYTPLSTTQNTYYGLDLVGISVGGTKLPISATVFQTSGMIIDSGTVITRLPPTAYSALKKVFREQMTKYPLTQGTSLLDTCYDLSNFATIEIPTISMFWSGNINVDIAPQGVFYFANGVRQVCLGFAPNGDDSDGGVFGNVQQKTMAVVYDVPGGKVGFGPGGCN